MHHCRTSTFVNRSNVSLSCKCFPVLLARSIHFPLNHLMFGLRRRSLASTLAMKLTSPPLDAGNTKARGLLAVCTALKCARCVWQRCSETIGRLAGLFVQNQFSNPKLIFVRHTSMNVDNMEGMFSFCFRWQNLRQFCLLEKVPCNVR